MIDGAPHEYKEKAGACSYCGNSPVNHVESYLTQTLSVFSSWRASKKPGIYSRAASKIGRILEHVAPYAFTLLVLLRIGGVGRDEKKAATYRSQVVWEEAKRRGIRMEQLIFFGKGTELYRALFDGRWHYFQSLPTPPHLTNDRIEWIDDKFVLKQALKRVGVAAPESISVSTLSQAERAFLRIGGAVVVKPRSGSRGRHTTVNVRTLDDLRNAYRVAKQLCHFVVVEEYLQGGVCRGTVVGGTLAGFFQALPPRIVGDGESTIEELIERQNRSRHERIQPIVMTAEHLRYLSRLDLALSSVLPLGRTIALTHRTGRLFGGRTRELLGDVHPKLRAYLERAATACGATIVGFDLIIDDPERDPDEQKWGIIEANSLPYIDLHYLPLEGVPTNVAAAVWDLWKTPVHN